MTVQTGQVARPGQGEYADVVIGEPEILSTYFGQRALEAGGTEVPDNASDMRALMLGNANGFRPWMLVRK